jgi:uncharacterized membrane protein YbhN (UPF0104 family)
MATAGVQVTAQPLGGEPMPDELSWPRLARRLAILVLVLGAVVAVVALLPGLGSLRGRFSRADSTWLVVAAALQLGSCLSYIVAFRQVFCRQMRWRVSYEIGMAELATNSLLSVGGAGGLALGAWILRRGGMAGAHVARRTVAFFLLTSLANITAVIVAGLGLGTGILHGSGSRLMGLIPAGVGILMVLAALHARTLARWLADRTGRPRIETLLTRLAEGVDEAVELLRRRDPKLLLGAAGYMLFDVAVLGVCFKAFGDSVPPGGVLLLAYLLGQLGGLIPIPGGVGGVDGGLIGTLVLYGTSATAAATAVIAYRGVLLILPVVLGFPAMLLLERRLRRENHDIAACAPGEEVEILGRGHVPAAELGRIPQL